MKRKLLKWQFSMLILVLFSLSIVIPSTKSFIFIPTTTVLGSYQGSYIGFNQNMTFTTYQHLGPWNYFDGKGTWTQLSNITITNWLTSNWLNYTVSSSGSQRFYYFLEPIQVYLNDILKAKGSGWNYISGTVIIDGATTNAAINWNTIPLPPPPPPYSPLEIFEINNEPPSGYMVYSIDNFAVYLPTSQSVGFQNDIDLTVTANVVAGTLNSTTNSIFMTGSGGVWTFTPNQNANITVSFTNGTGELDSYALTYVSINGALLDNQTTVALTSGIEYQLSWGVDQIFYTGPILPFGFIMGMIGLVSMIGGTMYTTYSLKKREWDKALTVGFVIALIGYALFIGWLAMGI